MNRAEAKEVRAALNRAFTLLSDELKAEGIHVQLGNASFSTFSNSISFKLNATVLDKDGKFENPQEEDFKRSAIMFGLKPDDLGKTFEANGKMFTICGLSPRAKKYPILAKSLDGKTYKFSSFRVSAALM